MTTVYVVLEGCQYEGTSIVDIYDNKEAAIKQAEATVDGFRWRTFDDFSYNEEKMVWSWKSMYVIIEERTLKQRN